MPEKEIGLAEHPSIIKLIEYGKSKDSITYDEVNDLLPDNLVNSDKIDEVIAILEKNKIKLEDEAENLDLQTERIEK